MSTWFQILVILHILSVVVAFAPAVLAVVPGSRDGALGALERAGRQIYAPALIVVGLLGILCVVASDDAFAFSDTWVSLAFVVWIVMNGVFHAMVLSGQRHGDERRVVTGQAIMTILLIVAVWLMVSKPF